MDKIGIRACREIYNRMDFDHDLDDICFEIELSRASLYQYRRGNVVPSAKILRRMALAGYDVIYILTGERK
jgi:transcriptional regulator with XRE-family HTH domain